MIEKPANNIIICGIDEAGRGPLAGPVYAAAVILYGDFKHRNITRGNAPNGNFPHDIFPADLLNDSKKLNPSRREKAREIILEKAFAYGIGSASHTEIDDINILQASLLAMKRAFEDMMERSNGKLLRESLSAVIDGKFAPDIDIPCTALVKADAQVPEVMAASILAKTERDHYMDKMAALYPQYGYEKHKGYPTKAHREAVLKYGPSPIQRVTFTVR